jgi:hypothetical protein
MGNAVEHADIVYARVRGISQALYARVSAMVLRESGVSVLLEVALSAKALSMHEWVLCMQEVALWCRASPCSVCPLCMRECALRF